jgi:uncharacterized protein YrzB (UPF0473 family)
VADEELPVETVTLIDEEGNELLFALHDAFDVEDVTYYLVEGVEDPELVLVLREEEGKLVSIDGTEFDRIMSMLENDGG